MKDPLDERVVRMLEAQRDAREVESVVRLLLLHDFGMVAIGAFLSFSAEFVDGILTTLEPIALEESTPEPEFGILDLTDPADLLSLVLTYFGLMNKWGEDMSFAIELSPGELQTKRDALMNHVRKWVFNHAP